MYMSRYYNDDYLMHYGVLGMKWGIRRYVNYDGTLTAERKDKYMFKLTEYGNMDVMLHRGAFALEKTDDPGEVYYIRAPRPIWIDPHSSFTIDTGIYVNLPDGCIGYLRPTRTRACVSKIDETRIDDTGNKSIQVTVHCDDNTAIYISKGEIIAKLEIRPSIHFYIPENNKDMTKVNRIEIRKAPKLGRQYLILYAKSKGTECDETVILGDDGYPAKISRDIVESLELVDIMYTNLFFETEF